MQEEKLRKLVNNGLSLPRLASALRVYWNRAALFSFILSVNGGKKQKTKVLRVFFPRADGEDPSV